MKFLAKVLFLLLSSPLGVRSATTVPLVLQHVTIIDGMGRAPRPDQTVEIADGRIRTLGPAGQIKFDKTAHVIDGRGKFLIPGLWDMHVHIAADPSWSKEVLLPLLLANGITGVRDMGGDLDTLLSWKRDIESGKLLGPHIVAAGPWLAGRGRKTPEQFPVANSDEARGAVRELKQRGADFIKVLTLPSRDAFFAVADEAHQQGISFVGHLPLDVNAAEASDAGMHSIEHLYYSDFALCVSAKEETLRPQLIAAEKKRDATGSANLRSQAIASFNVEKATALWNKLKTNKTWVTPTLEGIYAAGHPAAVPIDKASLSFVPGPILKSWRAGVDVDPASTARVNSLAKLAENDWKLTGEMHAGGVFLLVGSDSLDEGVIPGFSLHLELVQLVKAGFTPMEAIHSATVGAAEFLGDAKDLGTIETGKRADLVLLDANPAEDIANTRKIFAVIRDGQFLDRQALNSMLAKASAAARAVR
ncbi:MAG TPA: amidohydrolase family protein [Candidatus Acidoferrum sp.]|nr:amidohydrolase family protein [Candidatus Acidoferrum sp.]